MFNRRVFLRGLGLISLGCVFGCESEYDNFDANIMDFGATGNGVTEDTLSLLNSLEYLKQIGGGKLYVPPGTYLINRSVQFGVFKLFKGIDIIGSGERSVFILSKGSLSFASFSNLSIKKLKFIRDFKETNLNREKHQINMSAFDGLIIDDVTFSDFGPTNNELPIPGSTVLFLYAGSKTSVDSPNLLPGSSYNFKIVNSRFIAGGDRTVNFGLRVYTEFYADENDIMSNGEISDCTFDGFNWNALELAGPKTQHVKVKDCKVTSGGITGVEIDKGASFCTIKRCSFSDLRGNVDVEYYQNTAVTGVLLQGSATLNLVGKGNVVEDIKVSLFDTLANYPNDVWGVAIVDVSDSTVKGVSVNIEPNFMQNRSQGRSISIRLGGICSGNIISDCHFSEFECGILADETSCIEIEPTSILDVDFPKHLNIDSLFECNSEITHCSIIYENLRFEA